MTIFSGAAWVTSPALRFAKRFRRARNWGRIAVIAVPLLWLSLFFLIPFLVVFKISFAETAIAVPPYSPLFDWNVDESIATVKIFFQNFQFLLEDDLYAAAYLNSLKIGAISTALTLLIGYPVAYFIATSPSHRRPVLLALVILPFWTSFLLRVYAWMGFLKTNGLINNALLYLGIIDEPLAMLNTDFAVYVGIVYTYLPFMILPLYTTLEKLDASLNEASADLGGRPWQTFFSITLPLSLPGIIAGSLLVFIPAIGEFVIPALLGGSDTLMIGRVLWDEFFLNRDWPMASAVAVVMLLFLVIPIALFRNYQGKKEEGV
jgi:putrescine transport system permease protein